MISVELNQHRDLVSMIEDKYRGDQIYKAMVMGINIDGNIATVHLHLGIYNVWWVEGTFRLELSEGGPPPSPVVAKLQEIIAAHRTPEQEDQAPEELELESEEELRKELRGRIADLTPGYRWHVIARDERESVELAFLRIDAVHDVAEVFSDDAITSMLYSLSVGRQLEAERTIAWLELRNLWTGGKLHFPDEDEEVDQE